MALFQHLPANTRGRDFVVGDVHGCFEVLRELMQKVGFSYTTDRMLSVGDLVDRGPSSHEAMDWLDQPWFFAVRGNHEQMVIDAAAGRADKSMHIANGALWYYGLPQSERERVAIAFEALPIAIQVDTARGAVGIVHAEVPGDDWAPFVEYLRVVEALPVRPANFDHMERFALWGRDIIRGRSPFNGVANITRVMVGHTPVADWATRSNVHYLDTGACFGRRMTAICLQDGHVVQSS